MQYPVVDYLLYSRHHSARQCIDTVRRNNTLITNVPWERILEKRGQNYLSCPKVHSSDFPVGLKSGSVMA